MRAARMLERNGTPVLEDVPEIDAPKGTCRIEVLAAGLYSGDLLRCQGPTRFRELPYTIGGEGVDGCRWQAGLFRALHTRVRCALRIHDCS